MKIAVASGKGGTGKTLVSVNLAAALAGRDRRICYVDCDVEAPNGHLFLRPDWDGDEAVTVGVPRVDATRCDGCGRCGQLCQYSAILPLPGQVLTFPELCHGCGGCMRICPQQAIEEIPRRIGTVRWGRRGGVDCIEGRAEIGSVLTPAVIRATQRRLPPDQLVVLDCPPGTSCPVVASVRDADFVLLVTEPTPFGLHDLTLAVDLVRQLRKPFAVVVNRADIGDDRVQQACGREQVPILVEIPHDRRVAESTAAGELLIEAVPDYGQTFVQLGRSILAMADDTQEIRP